MNLQDLFSTVLNMSLTGSVVIGFVLLARLMLRKAPKVFSYALWAVVLFRLLCPVSISSALSLLNFVKTPVAESEGIVTSMEYIPVLDVDMGHVRVADADIQQTQINHTVTHHDTVIPENRTEVTPTPDAVSQQATAEPAREPIYYAAYIWLVGIGVMLVYNIISYWRLRKRLTGALRLRKNLYLADHIPSAFVMGVFRPRIYLPSILEVSERRYIIAHERYHIRRKDHIIKLLAYGALCLHWFNPLVWVAFTLSGKDMEMSCDEAVIGRLGPRIRADYSASLLRLATGHRIIAGTPLAFGEGDTKGRVLNMARWRKPKIWVIICAAIICIGVLVACAVNPASEVTENTEATLWITETDPKEACQKVIDELKARESYYILAEYDSGSYAGTIEYRRHGNNLLVDDADNRLYVGNIYFEGSYGTFYGDYWAMEREYPDYDPNYWLDRWSPEEKQISGMVAGGNTIVFDAVWPHQLYEDQEYRGRFIYTFNSDGSLESIQREYTLESAEGTSSATTDKITIMEEAPEDTYAAIKTIADQCVSQAELERLRNEADVVDEVPSNKTSFDKEYEYGAGQMGWDFVNSGWRFKLGAENATPTSATLVHCESHDGHKTLVAEAGFWLEELVDGQWRYVDESKTNAACPENRISVSWNTTDSYTIDWSDSYGALDAGYYRIGRNYTVTMDSGESETQVCYAKFRIMASETDVLLKKCEAAFDALLNADSYHILATDFMTQHDFTYYMTTEVWKRGGDYLSETRYINWEDPDILEGRRGSMMRGGNTYDLEWSGDSVTSPLRSWNSNTYMDLTNFTLWTFEFEWYDSRIEAIIADDNSISILETYDFDDQYDNTRITLTFDDEGKLTGMERAYLAGVNGDSAKMEVVVDTVMTVVDTTAAENAQIIDSQDVSKPVAFSYQEDQKAYPDAATSGFVNTTAQNVDTMEAVITAAKEECILPARDSLYGDSYNMTRIFYDESTKMWKVEFSYAQDDDVWQAVYLNQQGITKMIATGDI